MRNAQASLCDLHEDSKTHDCVSSDLCDLCRISTTTFCSLSQKARDRGKCMAQRLLQISHEAISFPEAIADDDCHSCHASVYKRFATLMCDNFYLGDTALGL